MHSMFNNGMTAGPVECLGHTFRNDDARREHFLKLLAEKLKDPEFRNQEGFPQGADEAILAMSDPPYYTACPNPWLRDFIACYGKPYDPCESYSREPLAIDVSVGKTDQLYKAHGYHTKVPHLAIVPSILHYTEPGDIVLDGFAGSGMTGVAAQWCGSAPAVYRHGLEMEWKTQGKPAPKWGARRVILNDLSPAATFIAANYNLPFDVDAFAKAGKQLLKDIEDEIGWMYETSHTDGKTKGKIRYTVWSEVLACASCAGEVVFTTAALDEKTHRVRDVLTCPHCGAQAKKEQMDLQFESFLDPATTQMEKRPKRVPVLIWYQVGKTAYSKKPDRDDIERVAKIALLPLPTEVPTDRLPDCQMTRVGRMKTTNSLAVHYMFLPRAAQAMGLLWRKATIHPDESIRSMLLFMVEQAIWGMSTLARYTPTHFSQVNQYLSGVFYVSSQHAECSPWYILDGKLSRLSKAFRKFNAARIAISNTGTAARLSLAEASIDYIFTDPPFGENIYYADLNLLVESWHRVKSDPIAEAIVDRVRLKGVSEYQDLMHDCFREYYRVLKPGRWMTVVFSNSRAAVWNAIQVGLQQAGFVVAEVSALNKVQGSFQQVMSTTAVKQDLVISVYKPNGGLEQRLSQRGASTESAWDFVETHLRQLPVTKHRDGELEQVVERDPRRVYDRMVAWFVRHDYPVPLSSDEFLTGLQQRDFPERDGMIFLPSQVGEYDKKRAQVEHSPQMELFVSDERSAIDWLADFLKKRPSTYQEVHPEFITQLGAGWRKHEEKPELTALLEDNFLRYQGTGPVPTQISNYLSKNFHDCRGLDKEDSHLIAKAKERWYVPDPNKAADLEQRREKSLLKEFETYRNHTGRRLREFRLEVLRAGFKAAWSQKDLQTIIKVAGKIPEVALQEDEKLLLWYDQALTLTEAGG
ncbi:DNA methyltransferase [Lamprobacter modestohalophilus]|uniref:DNA methyltransferase n=1 Tax=Lamprobacter modestohalophilus TaxID=1064514 RepID=UPI002ADEBB9F|nr:DNA methyltransferase [Lamprobacter modestohalophilus]MEA1051895.1 DNA methyltransferase [Lamprobacter modestohalophilus]